MHGIIIVAPAEAKWAARAEHELADAELLVARLYEPKLLSLLISPGGEHAVAVDSRIAGPALRVLRGCAWSASKTTVVHIHEGAGFDVGTPERSRPWPTTVLALRQLFGLDQQGSV